MNELPIVILSKQLKYSLATDKVKTLQKAIELLPKIPETQQVKRKNIQALVNKYTKTKNDVVNQFQHFYSKNTNQSLKGQSTQQMGRFFIKASEPFYQFLFQKCICQIFGPKGSGKTSVLLHFAEKYAQSVKDYKKTSKIILLNCVSGITQKRLQNLIKLKQLGTNIQCLQIGYIEQIVKIITKTKEQLEEKTLKNIMIGIDMMVLQLMTKQKPKIFINKIFKIIAELVTKYSCCMVFTNLVQHKYQLGNQQLYNHASYYCQSTAEYLTQKLFLQRPDKQGGNRFKLTNIKGKKLQSYFQIGESGIKQMKVTHIQQ